MYSHNPASFLLFSSERTAEISDIWSMSETIVTRKESCRCYSEGARIPHKAQTLPSSLWTRCERGLWAWCGEGQRPGGQTILFVRGLAATVTLLLAFKVALPPWHHGLPSPVCPIRPALPAAARHRDLGNHGHAR